jgi:hypothetical protein
MSEEGVAAVLQAGEPQGCPASPIIWAIVMDMALTHARKHGGKGVDLDGEQVQTLAFADDLSAADDESPGLKETVQCLVVAMGAVGVRFNGTKSFYAWSQGKEGLGDEEDMVVWSLNGKGQWRKTALTSIPPKGTTKGKTEASRGVARYLGVMYAFTGCEAGDRWEEQRRKVSRQIEQFFGRCDAIRPTMRQFGEAAHGVLLGRVLLTWKRMVPTEEEIRELRGRVARRAARCAGVMRLGKEDTRNAAA